MHGSTESPGSFGDIRIIELEDTCMLRGQHTSIDFVVKSLPWVSSSSREVRPIQQDTPPTNPLISRDSLSVDSRLVP